MYPMIELERVHVLFDHQLALDVERLVIAEAERVFVLGKSGSGKTTLARVIKGRLRPTSGGSTVLGCDPASSDASVRRVIQRRIAMIDQEFFLIPRMSVVGNVLAGALGRVSPWKSLFGWYPASEWKKAEAILREVELDGRGNCRVETLSGGQRQRVAIARALMQDADIIVADEPVSALDPELAEDALELLVECAKRRGVTLLVSLHQPELARRFASRFIGLFDGRIVYDGPPEGFGDAEAELIYRGNGIDKREDSSDEHPEEALGKKRTGPRLRVLGR